MFDGLTERLTGVFDRLSGRGVLSEKDVDEALREVRVALLDGEEPEPLRLALNPPTVILIAGLQGSGKTTMTGKLALRLAKFERQKVLVASLDTRRPAAMEQLAILAKQAEVESLPIVAGQG